MLNMFRILLHPSSRACDFSIVSPHWSCVLVSMCVGVSVWLGWGGILHYRVTSPLLGPNILLNTLFSHTLNQLPSLNASNQVTHPYKTEKIIFLFILIFIFLIANCKTRFQFIYPFALGTTIACHITHNFKWKY